MKLKTLAKIFGGMFGLVIAALFIAPLFISAEFLKSQLTAQVKAATGRDLVIKGKTTLSLFPSIAVSAEDVTLGNPSGFKSPYLVHLEKLATGAALRPLLAGNLAIDGVTLDGATIYLEQNAAGAKNYDFAGAKAKPAAEPAKTNDAKASPIKNFALGDVSIKRSDITISKPGNADMAVKNITVLISGADGRKPLKLSGAADYKGQSVKLDVSITKSREFLAQQVSPLTLNLALPGGAVQFTGTASLVDGATLDGKLEALIDSVPGMLAWATGKPATGGLPHAVRLESAVAMRGPKAIALSGLSATVDGTSATGKLALDMEGAVPAINGALQLAELDLNTFAGGAAAGGDAPSRPASGGAAGWSEARIETSGLRAANADVTLKIGKLISGKLEVKDIAATLKLAGGIARLNLANAGLYGGAAKGTVSVDGSGATAGIASDISLSGIQIEPLMTALSGASKLAGTANIALNVRGAGVSQRAIISSLGGNASLKVTDGAIKGINLAQFLREAKKGFLFADGGSEKTDFSELGATFAIAQGLVTNKDFLMKAPIVSAKGEGTVNLPNKTVNYRLSPIVSTNLKGQGADAASGLEIPLIIAGPWSNPSITPDLLGAVQNGLKNPAALKQNIKNIKETIGQFNSPKDLGRVLLGNGKAADVPPAPATAAPQPTPGAAPAPSAPVKKSKNEALIEGVGGLLQGLGGK